MVEWRLYRIRAVASPRCAQGSAFLVALRLNERSALLLMSKVKGEFFLYACRASKFDQRSKGIRRESSSVISRFDSSVGGESGSLTSGVQ